MLKRLPATIARRCRRWRHRCIEHLPDDRGANLRVPDRDAIHPQGRENDDGEQDRTGQAQNENRRHERRDTSAPTFARGVTRPV